MVFGAESGGHCAVLLLAVSASIISSVTARIDTEVNEIMTGVVADVSGLPVEDRLAAARFLATSYRSYTTKMAAKQAKKLERSLQPKTPVSGGRCSLFGVVGMCLVCVFYAAQARQAHGGGGRRRLCLNCE